MIKFWRGQHVVSVSQRMMDEQLANNKSAAYFCHPESIRWQPKAVPAVKPVKNR
jgi:hypothetical protein